MNRYLFIFDIKEISLRALKLEHSLSNDKSLPLLLNNLASCIAKSTLLIEDCITPVSFAFFFISVLTVAWRLFYRNGICLSVVSQSTHGDNSVSGTSAGWLEMGWDHVIWTQTVLGWTQWNSWSSHANHDDSIVSATHRTVFLTVKVVQRLPLVIGWCLFGSLQGFQLW